MKPGTRHFISPKTGEGPPGRKGDVCGSCRHTTASKAFPRLSQVPPTFVGLARATQKWPEEEMKRSSPTFQPGPSGRCRLLRNSCAATRGFCSKKEANLRLCEPKSGARGGGGHASATALGPMNPGTEPTEASGSPVRFWPPCSEGLETEWDQLTQGREGEASRQHKIHQDPRTEGKI